MPKTPPTRDEEIGYIEEALHRLLSAAIIAGSEPAIRKRDLADCTYSAAELGAWMDRPKVERDAEEIIGNPVGWACRKAVRALGKRLHELGGTSLMSDVAERVADRDDANWSRRTSIMDHRWDGIGEPGDPRGFWVA